MSLLAGGTVDLTSFYEALEVDLTYFSTTGKMDKKDALLLPVEKLLNIVRRGIMDNYGRGSGQVSRKVEALFVDYDVEKLFRVNRRDFSRVMLALKLNLLEDEVDTLFDKYSVEKYLNYRQFIKSLALDDDSHEDPNLASRPVNKVIDLIRTKMAVRYESETVAHRKILQIFREMDSENRTKVDKRECARAFALLKIDLPPREIETLFEKFDFQRENLFNYKDFIDALYPDSNPNLNSNNSSNSSTNNSAVVLDLLDRLGRELQANIRAGHLTASKIRKILTENASSGSPSSSSGGFLELSRRDFFRAMRALNCERSTRELDQMFDYFDATHRNHMNGEEFLTAIGLGLGLDDNDNSRAATKHSVQHIDIEKLLHFARKKVEDSVGSGSHATKRLKDLFLEMDGVRSGLVDRRQFSRALSVLLKVDLTSREIDALFDHFDKRGKEAIPYNEFISSLFPSAVNKEDSYVSRGGQQRYDPDLTGLMDSIRRKLEDYGGSGSQSAGRIKEIFAEIDINNSGDIDKVPIIR